MITGLKSDLQDIYFAFHPGITPHTHIHRMAGLGYAGAQRATAPGDRGGLGESFLRKETLSCGGGHLLLIPVAQGWHILCFRRGHPDVGGCVLLDLAII